MPAQPGLPERDRTQNPGRAARRHRVPDIGPLDQLADATQHLGALEQLAERCCGIAMTSFLYGGQWLERLIARMNTTGCGSPRPLR
jgi:hypothetical protein